MNDWFDERYIKEISIEEQIRGQVRAECHYMDKVDVYEWIVQDEIKIMNLQSKINKINEILNRYAKTSVEDYKKIIKFYKELKSILKEDK